jgi:hypothetical protein
LAAAFYFLKKYATKIAQAALVGVTEKYGSSFRGNSVSLFRTDSKSFAGGTNNNNNLALYIYGRVLLLDLYFL